MNGIIQDDAVVSPKNFGKDIFNLGVVRLITSVDPSLRLLALEPEILELKDHTGSYTPLTKNRRTIQAKCSLRLYSNQCTNIFLCTRP